MTKVIGFLSSGSENGFSNFIGAFHEGLESSGYVDGQNVSIVFRWADGNYETLPQLAADLVRQRVDLIATTGGVVSAQAAMRAANEIPVLFVSGYDPEKMEFREKEIGRGSNATGVNLHTTESVPERLALLRQLVPNAGKVAVLLRPGTDVYKRETEEAEKASLLIVEASGEGEFRSAFASAKDQADAMLVCADPSFTNHRKKLVALAEEYGLPTAYALRAYVEAGGLMSYGPDLHDAYRHVGEYAGKILAGSSPDALGVRMNSLSDFELVINGKTAAALGLTIPTDLQQRAEII
jgi:putative ABC transport system substrate-binding protein